MRSELRHGGILPRCEYASDGICPVAMARMGMTGAGG
jgi:hypothetical protein